MPPTPGSGALPGGEAFPLVAAGGGGMTKAYERELRGPSLLAAQGNRNQFSEDVIGRVGERNEAMAKEEYGLALEQERSARDREQAAQQSMLERQDEMAERQADFDNTARQLSKMGQTDRGRFWASRTTGQKVAGVIELMLAGFRGAPSMLQKRIDDDVKAQEFAYYATRDTANAKQTAFQMAMQKYQNADAARAMARAAAIDVTQAQLAQVSAKWKGTEAANKADIALAALQDEKMMQIANGIQFVPSQYRGRVWVDPATGLQYNESQAHEVMAKIRERNFNRQTTAVQEGTKLDIARAGNETDMAKAQLAAHGKVDEGAGKISAQLQGADVPKTTALAEAALASMNASAPSFTESVARSVQPGFLEARTMPAAANRREQDWAAFKNQALKTMMGNVTEGEFKRAEAQFGAADTAEQRKAAIDSTMGILREIERNAKAGQSPAAQAEFDRRRESASTGRAVAPPGAKAGW